MDIVYPYLKKAFNSVPHYELLVKLWRIGITGPLWFLFKDFLSNRQSCVRYRNIVSDSLPVLSWVPQGSVLDPLLFLNISMIFHLLFVIPLLTCSQMMQKSLNPCLLAMTNPSFRSTWTLSMPGVLSGRFG